MPSFRSGRSQADHVVRGLVATGRARHGSRDDGKIHSLGTARNYRQALATCARWLRNERGGSLRELDRETALRYLDCRATELRQPGLDQCRLALQALLGERLPRVKSEIETVLKSRAYTADQIAMVAAAQTPRNALATQLAACGLRAHELLTIRRADEQAPSSHRIWRADLHASRIGELYVVTGKGGLRRSVMLPADLARRLEDRRLDTPRIIFDRTICYESRYDIGGGQAWSASFSNRQARP